MSETPYVELEDQVSTWKMIYSTLKKYKFGYEIIQSESQSNMYSLSHASTSSSPHLQLRTTVLRRTSSSLSFQAIPGLDDDNAGFGENIYEYSNHDQHDHKTLFTWGTIHLFLGILLWLKGQWGCGLGKLFYSVIVYFIPIT